MFRGRRWVVAEDRRRRWVNKEIGGRGEKIGGGDCLGGDG